MSRPGTRISSHCLALALVVALAGCSPAKQAAIPPAPATTAAAPAPASLETRAFMIGELEATALRDGVLDFPNDNKVFGVGHKPEEVAAVLTAAGLPTDQLQLGLDPLLVKAGDRVMLFDTGAGKNFGTGAGHLAASLAAAGVSPQAVTDIFISHVHGDHTGGLVNDGGTPAFPNAAIHLSAPEWTYLKSLDAKTAGSLGIGQYAALVAAIAPKVATFAPGAEIIPGVVKAVEVKGHTPGHSGYLISSGQASLLYIGDAAHHFVVSVQKPDWPNGFDADAAAAAASRAALLAQMASSGQRIYAVHFPFPGLGKFEKRDAGFVWVAE